MHHLVIDIGNTNTKVAVFKGKDLIHHQVFKSISPDDLSAFIKTYDIRYSAASSVSEDLKALEPVLRKETRYVQFSTEIQTGLKNYYRSSSTLGLDRFANIIAAFYHYPNQNCFIIDAGTCITYDFLNKKGEYFGGSISPGVGMRFKALNHFTGRLPLVEWNNSLQAVPQGVDTLTAIKNGVLEGVLHEVSGFISAQIEHNEEVNVLITGGDAAFLSRQLKSSIFAPKIINDPHLVLKGINEVIALEYV